LDRLEDLLRAMHLRLTRRLARMHALIDQRYAIPFARFFLQRVIASVGLAAQIEDGLEAKRRVARDRLGRRLVRARHDAWLDPMEIGEHRAQEPVVGPDEITLGPPPPIGRREVKTAGVGGLTHILLQTAAGAGPAAPRIRIEAACRK